VSFIFKIQLLEGFSREAVDEESLFSYLFSNCHQVNVSSVVNHFSVFEVANIYNCYI